MIARFVSLYLRCLFALVLLLFVLTLLLQICALLGAINPLEEYGKDFFYCAFAILVLAFGLARDRNVWNHEFKICPRWLQIATLIFMIYGTVFVFVQVIYFKNSGALEIMALLASGFFLVLESISVCILYSLLWTGLVSVPELTKRIRISLIMLAVCVAVIVAAHTGYLPHRSRQE